MTVTTSAVLFLPSNLNVPLTAVITIFFYFPIRCPQFPPDHTGVKL